MLRISSESRMLTVPPAQAKLAKLVMLGLSTSTTTKRFSSGLPPHTLISVRKSLDPAREARQRLHIARNILQRTGRFPSFARLAEVVRNLDFVRSHEH